MKLFKSCPKKLARMRAARKKLPKASRMAFLTVLMAVTMHFQAHLLEHNSVHSHAAQVDVFGSEHSSHSKFSN